MKLLTCCRGQRTGEGCQTLTSLSPLLFIHSLQTFRSPASTHLLLSQLQQLFLGLLHLASGPSDGDLVRPGPLGGEMDVDATAILHDGAHKAALRADQRVVQLGRDGDLCLLNVGLEGR